MSERTKISLGFLVLNLVVCALLFLTGCGTEPPRTATNDTAPAASDAQADAPGEPSAPSQDAKTVSTKENPVPVPAPALVKPPEPTVISSTLTSSEPIWLDDKTSKHWTLLIKDQTIYQAAERRCATTGGWRLPTKDEWESAVADEIPVGSDELGWSISDVWVTPGTSIVIQGAPSSMGSIYCIEK